MNAQYGLQKGSVTESRLTLASSRSIRLDQQAVSDWYNAADLKWSMLSVACFLLAVNSGPYRFFDRTKVVVRGLLLDADYPADQEVRANRSDMVVDKAVSVKI